MLRHRWLRDAVRSRVLVNLLLVAVAAIAVLAAVLGPLLVRAMAQFTVEEAIARAGSDGTAIAVSLEFNGDDPAPFLESANHVLAAASAGSGATLWNPPEVWTESSQNLGWSKVGAGTGTEQTSRVRLAGTDCAGLVLVSGACPNALGQVAISAADAQDSRITDGAAVTLRPPSTTTGPSTPPAEVTVVGTYDPDRSTLPRRPSDADSSAVTALPLVVTARQAAVLTVPVQVLGRIDLRSGLRLQDEPTARSAVAAAGAAVLLESRNVDVSTGLIDLLDRVDARVRSATILVVVTEVQALALGVFALAVVLQRIGVARAAEWGIGRLRGVPRRRWYTSIYAEPAAALVVGCLLGFFAGLLAARMSVRSSLGTQTPIEPWRWPVLLAALAVLVAFLVALLAVSAPSLRRPLIELIQQRSESRGLSIVGAVAQSAVVLLAAATIYQLRVGGILSGGGSQLGLLAPALLALTLALAAVRIAVLLVRRVTARPPRSLVGLIVGRQAARTPSSFNPAVVVAVGVALAVFATQVMLVSARNQELRATAVVGARTVLQVEAPAGGDLLSLVNAADPSGRYAMAVKERSAASDTGVGRILAVDSSRFAAVGALSPASLGADLSSLRPVTADPVILKGTRVEATIADVKVTPGVISVAGTPPADPVLELIVVDQGQWKGVELGATSSTTALRAALPCADGCRLVAIGLRSDAGAAYTAELTITSISTDQQTKEESDAWLRAAGWHSRVGDQLTASPRALSVPTQTADGMHLKALDEDGGNAAAVLPVDSVDPLPALVAPATEAQPFAGIPNAVLGRGLDGQPQILQVVATPPVLPRLLDDGVLVDLLMAGNISDPAQGLRRDEVWLAADAPPEIEQALTAQGLKITGRQDLAAQAKALQEEPSTRAAASARYLGLAALALTLIALIAAQAADVTRRRPDWKSLLDGGLPARTVLRLAFIEIAAPVVIGVLVGVASGVAGFALAASKLPLVDLTAAGPPLDLGVGWAAVAVLGAAVLVVVLIVSGTTARLETRTRTEQP